MSARPPRPTPAGLVDPPEDPGAVRLVEALVAVAGPERVRAVLLFGSHMVQASPDRFSAYDLVLVVESYRAFYDALARAGLSSRSPAVQAALNRVLAPNVIALAPEGWEGGPVAKIMVLEADAFERALSAGSADHFLKGRLVQKVALLHARDDASAAWVGRAVHAARTDILRWARPSLPERFTPGEAALRMLQRSYAGEVRPEAGDRVLDVFQAQRPFLEGMMSVVLDQGVRDGLLLREGTAYRFAHPAAPDAQRRVQRYFLRSKLRATARWVKHVATFDNWLDYIARKVERRTGMRVEITPWERRLPYILLWPKVFRVLRARPTSLAGGPKGRDGGHGGGR